MAYKNLTVYDFQNKLNSVLPIYDDENNLSLLGISESPGYSNQLCTATTNHIAILQNLQSANFSPLYYKTSQSVNSNRRLYDEYENTASITKSERTVTYGVNNSNEYLNRAYISYTGDPNSGYATTYSQNIKDHRWSSTNMGVGYCLGYYESKTSYNYSYTAEQQYKYLFTNFSFNGYQMGLPTLHGANAYLMYYTYFKSNIGNCTLSIGSATWLNINSYYEDYPTGSTDMTGGVSAFNWDSTALSSYNNAYSHRSWPTSHANITGMKRSTLQKWNSYVTQSDIESELNTHVFPSTGFVKYLYSPKDPGDVICGRINSDNYWCNGLAVDGSNYSGGSVSFNVFSSFYGFNSELNNYHYTPIWVYAAYDITQCKSATWYKNYLLMTQRYKYYGSYTIYDWDALKYYSNYNTITVYYNKANRSDSFNNFFSNYVSYAPCMGYVVIPVALILVCYIYKSSRKFSNNFLSSNINNVQAANSTYVYPKFSYETYDAFVTSTNYRQSINTLANKVVKCGSASDTRYLMDRTRPIYWNSTSSHGANACLKV